MRVAVVITGQMRDYKINVENHIKHLIEPNGADVFVYACNKNTVHTIGTNITQKYNITSTHTSEEMRDEISRIYGPHLTRLVIDEDENLDVSDFGTLGYFKRKMNNQMSNIRKGFLMAIDHSRENGFEYDIIVRCRPDNSMFPRPILFQQMPVWNNHVYSTVYPSGHRDPWFFSYANPKMFDKYCSFVYMENADESRTDNDFDCPELSLEKYLIETLGAKILVIPSISRPFYEYDKKKPIVDFPHCNWNEKLLDASGNWVSIPGYEDILKKKRKTPKEIGEEYLMHKIESLYLKDPKNFLLLEIGANDGYVCDRMHRFVKKYDPNAIMVEPIKGYFDKLKKNYSDMKNIKYENVAISDTDGTATMTYIPQEDIQKGRVKFRLEEQPELHQEHWAGGLGSLYKDKNNLGCPELQQFQKQVEVPTKTLEYLEEKYGISNYENVVVQTDCEGHDYEILKTFDFDKLKPKIYISEIYSKTRYPPGHPRYGTDEGLYTKEDESAAIDIYYNNGYSLYRSNDLVAILEEFDTQDKHLSCWEDTIDIDEFIGWCGDYNQIHKRHIRKKIIDSKYESVLDLGAGVCSEYYGFKSDGYEIKYTATEITPKYVEYAKERKIDIIQSGLESLPLPDNSYDCCICVGVMTHQKCYKKPIFEMLRVSKEEVIIDFFKPFAQDVVQGVHVNSDFFLEESDVGVIQHRILDKSGDTVGIYHYFDRRKLIEFLDTIEGIEYSFEKESGFKHYSHFRIDPKEIRTFLYIKKKK